MVPACFYWGAEEKVRAGVVGELNDPFSPWWGSPSPGPVMAISAGAVVKLGHPASVLESGTGASQASASYIFS